MVWIGARNRSSTSRSHRQQHGWEAVTLSMLLISALTLPLVQWCSVNSTPILGYICLQDCPHFVYQAAPFPSSPLPLSFPLFFPLQVAAAAEGLSGVDSSMRDLNSQLEAGAVEAEKVEVDLGEARKRGNKLQGEQARLGQELAKLRAVAEQAATRAQDILAGAKLEQVRLGNRMEGAREGARYREGKGSHAVAVYLQYQCLSSSSGSLRTRFTRPLCTSHQHTPTTGGAATQGRGGAQVQGRRRHGGG